MKKVTDDIATEETESRIYEISYILVPTIPEEAVPNETDRLRSLITKAGEMISEEAPYLRELAYEMMKVINNENKRFTEGYFGWFKFESAPDNLETLKKAFESDQKIIRSLAVETVRENTLYTKRPAKKEQEVKVEEPTEAPVSLAEVEAPVEAPKVEAETTETV
jgi:ribosomal protein S6